MTTITEFRKMVKTCYPHVKVSIKTVGFSDLARVDVKCLTVTGDKPGELSQINTWAREAGIIPDRNIRFVSPRIPAFDKKEAR